ncbi:hypothetical protein SS50377_26823 [Spironucleus salmonicida]|uniref:Uncharacterized protein n=1 Tax=Spironucleus salmonicida TaxID=348837 RepID=V6LXD5_9EUKA|nr:hypothetical protein SS50377_26823 [Spironucleus salmonicida]|eukprot:EST49292.1 hypothetical protein SS50377_10515 [Spironucleus salmonicida]
MNNYCISCLKFINPEDKELQQSRNTCPACGMNFCCGYCSSDLTSHPCQLITKIKLKSLLFNPEIQTMQLESKKLINQYTQRKEEADNILNLVDTVQTADLRNDMILKESQEYYDIKIQPVYKSLFQKKDKQLIKNTSQQEIKQVFDPFLYPYFVRICDLYSNGLQKIKQNQKYIEHCSIEVLQQTSLLSSKQMKLITGFNEFVFLIKQLDLTQTNKELVNQFAKGKEIYDKLNSILTTNDVTKMIKLPQGIKTLIYELYMLVCKYMQSKLINNVNILVDQYQKSSAKSKFAESQIGILDFESKQHFDTNLVISDTILQAQAKEVELKQKLMIFQAIPIETLFHESKHQYINQIYENFNGLTQVHEKKIEVIEQIAKINKVDDKQSEDTSIINQTCPQQDHANDRFSLARALQINKNEENQIPQKLFSSRTKSRSSLQKWQPRAGNAYKHIQQSKQPLMLSQVLIGQQTNFQKPQMFTRKMICITQNKDKLQSEFTDFVQELQDKTSKRSSSTSNISKWDQLRKQHQKKINVFDQAKNLRQDMEKIRNSANQLLQVNILQDQTKQKEEHLIIDTRILHPFYKDFIHQKAIQNYRHQSNIWYIFTLYLNVQEYIMSQQQYRQNCIQIIRDQKYLNFCRTKQLYIGFNKVCKYSSQQRLELKPNKIALGTEGDKRIDLVNRLVDKRVNIMPSKARREMYQKLRSYIFELKGLRDFDGIVMGEPM